MSNRPPSIDGFIPRRSTTPESTGGYRGLQPSNEARQVLQRPQPAAADASPVNAIRPEQHHGLTRTEIESSLQEITDEEQKKQQKQHKHRRHKKIIKRVVIALLVIAVVVLGYVGVRMLIASGNIFRGDLLGLIQSAPLKTDANGRSNILVFGTSEDSDAHTANGGAGAPLLTDSIMVLSVNQEKNDAFMVSIPRDLWVQYGRACDAGYENRINALYQCFSNYGKDEEAGTKALQQKVSQVTGLEIQYHAQVNYTVLEEAVDAVGGVSVEIDSDDPRGIYDPNFDWKCNRQCNYVKYPNGPTGTMDGEHALALARARNAQGGYGLSRSNFDREQYQQKIMKALAQKAVSAGTVTNVGKVTSLIEALGNNLRTNFETKEIRTLMRLAQDIPQDKIVSIDLAKQGELAVVNDHMNGAGSIVRAVSGLYDYSSIIDYIKKQISSDPAVRESARIGVYNGSGVAGAAQTAADQLSEAGLIVSDVGNAPDGSYANYEIYDLTNEKIATKAKLESLYSVTAKATAPPLSVTGLDFVIIVGSAPVASPQP